MSKWKLAIILALILGLVATIVAFAGGFSVVTYTDVTATGFDPGKTITTPQYINNGDFKNWTNGKPDGWNVPTPVLSPNWEVHFASMELSPGVEATADSAAIPGNTAVGYFFRTGSSGSQFAGLSQQVSPALTTGTYWVQVHVTAWEQNVQSPYNSVAWYGFGSTNDPSSVTEWRELFGDTYVCANGNGSCNHLGRKESVQIEAGSYMHLWMGMKFPDHQAWTVFGLDDISITDFSDGINVDVHDFEDDGDIFWDPRAPR